MFHRDFANEMVTAENLTWILANIKALKVGYELDNNEVRQSSNQSTSAAYGLVPGSPTGHTSYFVRFKLSLPT